MSNVSSERQPAGAGRHNVLFRVMKCISLLWSESVSTQYPNVKKAGTALLSVLETPLPSMDVEYFRVKGS